MTETTATAGLPDAARERRAKADRISGFVLAVSMIAAFAVVLRTVITVATGPAPAGPGQPAPAFASVTPSGQPTALADLRGKVVLLDFWATWCPPCVASMPTLEKLHQTYGPKGFVVLGVNQEAGEEGMVRDFLAKKNITFPSVMDDGHIARDYGVFTFPTSFLIGRDGVVRSIHRGVAIEARYTGAIEELLAEAAPSGGAAK
ncbi:TlpA family protein disulfide reductase [Myxococcota bacterium]|nr:TlpA family protein disulfide reductase [Myxococcota bacterium]